MEQHPDHSDQLARLNRAKGQLEAVITMVKGRKYCLDLVYQLRAVRKAVSGVEANILQKHVNSCVLSALTERDAEKVEQKVAEIGELLRKNL